MFYKEYSKPISYIKDGTMYDEIFSALPRWRQQKILKYNNESTRRLSLLSGYLLQQALDEYGYDIGEIVFNEYGKPYLKNSGLYFSISHSNEMAYIVISDHEVGCDVEYIRDRDVLKLAKRFFSIREYDDIASSLNPINEFYKHWTLKEAYTKAIGKGITIPLSSFYELDNAYKIIKNEIKSDYAYAIVIKENQ